MRLQRTVEGELNRLFVFELSDGLRVEGVLYRGDTLCVSTQVGCPVRCVFCASGRYGFIRNLKAEEIYGQLELVRSFHGIRRIAVAGIGEPLANWRNVKVAFERFRREGLRVSFYTCGFPLSNLPQLLRMPHNGVTLSLHTTDPATRAELMPGAGDLPQLLQFLRKLLPTLSRRKRKKISLALVLLKGVNDSSGDLLRFAKLAQSLGVGITLLRYNEVGAFESPDEEEFEKAFLLLRRQGIRVTLSTRFRRERIGGCGTLTVGGRLPRGG